MILHALKLTYQFMPTVPGESNRVFEVGYDTDRTVYQMVLRLSVHGQHKAIAFSIDRFEYDNMAYRGLEDYLERTLEGMCNQMKAQI